MVTAWLHHCGILLVLVFRLRQCLYCVQCGGGGVVVQWLWCHSVVVVVGNLGWGWGRGHCTNLSVFQVVSLGYSAGYGRTVHVFSI